ARSGISRNPKLLPLPQYEAHASQLLRLLLGLLLLAGHDGLPRCLSDEPTAGLVQSGQLGPWASAPLPKLTVPQLAFARNPKITKNLYFSVA
ncbi:MAG: hypothetical protein WB774_00515, partial [Xanthobacteraceae bacterium]